MLYALLNGAAADSLLFGFVMIVAALILIAPTQIALRTRKKRIADVIAIAVGAILAVIGLTMVLLRAF
jgi:VanZ family protein